MMVSVVACAALLAVVTIGATSSGVALGHDAVSARHGPTSRLVYSSDWTGHTQIFTVDPSARRAAGQLTFGAPSADCRLEQLACGFAYPLPSPDGKRVAYLSIASGSGSSLWIAAANGAGAHRVASGLIAPEEGEALSQLVAWSPDSTQVAYLEYRGHLHVVRADGSGDRVVDTRTPSRVNTVVWSRDRRSAHITVGIPSPNGHWTATPTFGPRPSGGIDGLIVTGDRTLRFDARTLPAWAPNSRLLAFSTDGGIRVADMMTGRTRRLTRANGFAFAWSPDGKSIAYIAGIVDRLGRIYSGDIRVVTLAGRVSSVVDSEHSYGGRIASLAWARPPASTRYRKPQPAPATRVSPEGLLVDGPIERIAADGSRVVVSACGEVFVWAPGQAGQSPPEHVASLHYFCNTQSIYTTYSNYTLALARDLVAMGEVEGSTGRHWELFAQALGAPDAVPLGSGSGINASALQNAVGEAVGSGDLLVFSSWSEGYSGTCCSTIVTTKQAVHRVDAAGCPCPALRTEPGPLIPLDADGGRIVVAGDGQLLVLDAAGAERLTVGVPALAAAISGHDLVVLVRGELRHYDAADARLLNAWPLPDVPSGRDCNIPATFRCEEISGRLTLQDTARGLATYVFDHEVHLFRLSDGADVTMGSGSSARIMDRGLVWADGSRLHLVSFAKLPFR